MLGLSCKSISVFLEIYMILNVNFFAKVEFIEVKFIKAKFKI